MESLSMSSLVTRGSIEMEIVSLLMALLIQERTNLNRRIKVQSKMMTLESTFLLREKKKLITKMMLKIQKPRSIPTDSPLIWLPGILMIQMILFCIGV
jgi:hypothetical protein